MKTSVHSFVSSCLICKQAKLDRAKYPGLLQPFPVPHGAWQVISLDFVEGLPKSANMDTIMVVVDKFSKNNHFLPLSHPFSAFSVAKLFITGIYKLHGMPTFIIFDSDKIFMSKLWQELFKQAGVTLQMSSAYHPQTDGQTERVNQCMETFLRCFVHACPKQWCHWLHLAKYWYNTSWHSALAASPFQVLYGHTPRRFGIEAVDSFPVDDMAEWLQAREVMLQLIKQHLSRAQDRMKRQAGKHRSKRQFQIGDMVFLKLQPYIQTSVAARGNQKLAFKFFGPFKVLEKIGAVAYKLELPASATIHPVFHVSQLKAAPPSNQQVCPFLPDLSSVHHVPKKILQRRRKSDGQPPYTDVLVKWSDLPVELATWENLDDMKRCFPKSPALVLAGSVGGGMLATMLMSCQLLGFLVVGSEPVSPTATLLETSGPSESRESCVV
jgi:hypothetical protein